MVALFYNRQEPIRREAHTSGIAQLTGAATAALAHNESEATIRGKDLHAVIEAVGNSNTTRAIACAAKCTVSIESTLRAQARRSKSSACK